MDNEEGRAYPKPVSPISRAWYRQVSNGFQALWLAGPTRYKISTDVEKN